MVFTQTSFHMVCESALEFIFQLSVYDALAGKRDQETAFLDSVEMKMTEKKEEEKHTQAATIFLYGF